MMNTARYIMISTLVAIMAIFSVRVCAQEVQMYKYSEADVKDIVENVAKSYKVDPEKEAKYRLVLTVAFARYWNLPEAKAQLGPNTLDDLRTEAARLSEHLKNMGNPQAELDTLQILLNEYQALKETIASKNLILSQKKTQTEAVNTQIAQKNSELEQLNAQAEMLSQKEKSLKAIVANLGLTFENAQSQADLSGVDEARIDKVIEDYVASRRAIHRLVGDSIGYWDNTVEALETLKSLKSISEDALKAMEVKFNPTRNGVLIQDIQVLVSKPGPTRAQKDYLASIATSLKNEESAVDNFCSILTDLAENYPCVPDDGTRNELKLNEVVVAKVQEYNQGIGASGDTYDQRYVLLNQVLQQVVDDLSEGSKMPVAKINDEDKFQSYLKSKANSVR